MAVISNNILAGASGSGGAAYSIDNSLRFNSADSAYLSRTPVAGNRKTWTWSGWVKRADLSTGGNQILFETQNGVSNTPRATLAFLTTNDLRFEANETGSAWNVDVRSNNVFRDASAWYHILIALDTTKSTASERLRIYINGSEVSYSTTTYPSQNADLPINQALGHRIGAGSNAANYLNAYLADIHFIDGQALAPTEFGEFDTYGIWNPIEYAGTYGTNGFRLDFSDSLTTTSIAQDASGNGNHWTANNITVLGSATPPTSDEITVVDNVTGGTISKGSGISNNTNQTFEGAYAPGGVRWRSYFDVTNQNWAIQYSTNNANSWSNLVTGSGSDGRYNRSVTACNGTYIITYSSSNTYKAVGSINASRTSISNSKLYVLSKNEDTGFICLGGSTSGILTTDGTNFSSWSTPAAVTKMQWNGTSAYVFINSTGGIYHSSGNISSWTSALTTTSNLTDLWYSSTFDYFYAITEDGTVYRSRTGASGAWTNMGRLFSSSTTATYLYENNFGIVAHQYPRQYAISSSGNTWTTYDLPQPTNSSSRDRGFIVLTDRIWVNISDVTTGMLTVDGTSWSPGANISMGTQFGTQNGIVLSDPINSQFPIAGQPGWQVDSSAKIANLNGTHTKLTLSGNTDLDTFVIGSTVNQNDLNASGTFFSGASSTNTAYVTGVTGTWGPGASSKTIVGPATYNNSKDTDTLIDSPTNGKTSSDTGLGNQVPGNYAVLNPLDNGGIVLANGNLDASQTTASIWRTVRASVGMSSGKWYWEVLVNNLPAIDPPSPFLSRGALGIATGQATTTNLLGVDAYGWMYYSSTGQKVNNNTYSSYGSAYNTAGDIVGVAFDADNGTLTFYKNNVSQGTAYTGLTSGPYFPAVSLYKDSSSSDPSVTCNFGQRPFVYTAPSGYKALCTANTSTPTIQDGSTAMDVVTYTGNGTSQTITGLNFSPDFVWGRRRNNSADHILVDTVRGSDKYVRTNVTNAEVTDANMLSGFTSDGFSVGSTPGLNQSGSPIVAWTWDGGSSTVTNTAGSRTSSVRASASAGFSIVTYTSSSPANNPNTIGHGLGVSPSMIIMKARTSNPGANDWFVYHKDVGNTKALFLNSTAAPSTYTYWNNTSPTSTVFSVGSGIDNGGVNWLAYCFAPVEGYSAFGSYTGNGSADGPFVYTGFRPKWVLLKVTNTTNVWLLYDTARSTYNVVDDFLQPNAADAEATGNANALDFLSNGFKLRGNLGGTNGSGNTYIYAAFAEHPFSISRAR